MSIKGQTHAKRAREFALKEKRERKKAKKEAQRTGVTAPELDGTSTPPVIQPSSESGAEWVQ